MTALTSSARWRIGGVAAAAALVLWVDYSFSRGDAEETAVVGPAARDRSTTLPNGDPHLADRRAPPSIPGGLPRGSSDQADLAKIARWQSAQDAAQAPGGSKRGERGVEGPLADPFAPVNWAAPPASVAVTARVPAPVATSPVAPPFPYSYIGRMSDAGLRTVFFAKGERVLAVKIGDLVDSVYRVDEIDEKQMKLTFMPMGQGEVVALGLPK